MISISLDVLFTSRIQSKHFKEHSSAPYSPTTILQHVNIVVRNAVVAIGFEAFCDQFENIRMKTIENNWKSDDFWVKHSS